MPRRRAEQAHRNLRATVAEEAARIMIDEGVGDFRAAKAKAVERLGFGRAVPLPGNDEVEAAVAARQRIFQGSRHAERLQALRVAALDIMRRLGHFGPRLVGAVLSGNATEHAIIEIHVFADAAEEVGAGLDALGLGHRAVEARHRMRTDTAEAYPAFRFDAGGFDCRVTVFPERRRGHPPLSPVDGRPMRRADLRELAELVEGGPHGAEA